MSMIYEEFTPQQQKILERYVTNTNRNIFVLRNLPEVIKGALFSRYSRSSLGLRSLLLKEFIHNEETAFTAIAGAFSEQELGSEEQIVAIKKAQNFYDRILDGYGDDSIGELGGAHLAIENVSMLAAKAVEDCRIGGSPLEKSTRYIYFDQKINGEYLFYRDPILMTSAYREIYLHTCNHLFLTYSRLVPLLTEGIGKQFPKDPEISQVAYTAALRAKVLDCLRGLLPASSLTNIGVYGNGRFFETLLQKLHGYSLAEMQAMGREAFQELSKVIPSFVRRAEPNHRHQKALSQFYDQMHLEVKKMEELHRGGVCPMDGIGVRLVSYEADAAIKVAAALLFSNSRASLSSLQHYCRGLSQEELASILEAGCNARENRRHKSPRALEHAFFTFEMIGDFGIYRDLHRHRMLTQERQPLSCHYGYFVPLEIRGSAMEEEYCSAMEMAKKTFDIIAQELPEEAQYVVPMGYNIHWYFHVNLRALQWLCELRSSPQGHPMYRYIAQELSHQVSEVVPQFARFFRFVDYDGYELGRLSQEIRNVAKTQKRGDGS